MLVGNRRRSAGLAADRHGAAPHRALAGRAGATSLGIALAVGLVTALLSFDSVG
jgi:hypothetical protein